MPSVAKRSQQFSNIRDTFIPIFSYVFARILEMFKIRWWLNEFVDDRDTVLASKIFMELTSIICFPISMLFPLQISFQFATSNTVSPLNYFHCRFSLPP